MPQSKIASAWRLKRIFNRMNMKAAWKKIFSSKKSKARTPISDERLKNLSHEIRTPLNAIIGFSDMLMMPNISNALKFSAVQSIKKNSVQLIQLLDQLVPKEEIDMSQVIADVAQAANSTAKENYSAHRCAHILLVEDSEDNKEIFEFFLKTAGHKVHVVDNGIEAVDVADRNDFDLILMDIQIPGISGKQAASQIRAGGYSKPIIALTAQTHPEEIDSCLKAGCSGQINKPVSGQDLLIAINSFLSFDKGAIPR
jgi:CheY-like chemotaxis protein